MVNVILFHNLYRSSLPSGENLTVFADAERLRERGHSVHLALQNSDELLDRRFASIIGAFSTVHAVRGVREGLRLADSIGPDVVHFHNLYPLWSPSLSAALRARGVPRLQVLHNYRFACLSANLYRDGSVCTRCVGKRIAIDGLVRGCYGGAARTTPVFISRALHWNTIRDAEHYLAISATVRQRAIENGVSADRVSLKPNHLPLPDEAPEHRPPGQAFLFIGRLDREKGVDLLVRGYDTYAARGGRVPLRIAGSGPLEEMVRAAAAANVGITWLGRLGSEEVLQEIRGSRAVVSPATWEEPFGRTVLEAWAQRRPVAVTNLGGPADLVAQGGGVAFAPDRDSLADALALLEDDSQVRKLGEAGYALYREKYTGAGTVEAYERAWHLMGIRSK